MSTIKGRLQLDMYLRQMWSESFGYTMADLKYAWNSGDNSVQMSPDVSLPQFNILGHRQRLIEV